MIEMWRACVAAALLSACGDNLKPTQELYVPFAPVFISYKTGSAAWLTPTGTAAADGSTTYELPVDGDFELVVVCARANGAGFLTQEAFGTSDDWDDVTGLWPCPSQSSVPTAMLSGQMDRPGTIFTPEGGAESLNPGQWSFHVMALVGKDDIAAVADHMLPELLSVRHDQVITMDTTEPTFDFTNEGDAVQFWTPSIDGIQNTEFTGLTSQLITKNDTQILLGLRGASPPASQLEDGDYQWFSAFFSGNGSLQSVDDYTDSAPQMTYTLLPNLSDISFGLPAASASWTSLPDGLATVEGQFSDDSNFQFVTVGANWLAEKRANEIVFDNGVPGLDPMWEVSTVEYPAFQVSKHAGSVSYGSMVGAAGIPVTSDLHSSGLVHTAGAVPRVRRLARVP